MDIARFGSLDAQSLLVLLSGTHGIEGLCGSGCQLDWLRSGGPQELPEDMAVVLIHFVNPYGGFRVCIENENNVDLNRNFLDYAEPLPANPRYQELHRALVCPQYQGPIRDAAEEAIHQFIEDNGLEAFLEAAAMGQYAHPDGFNFGGTEPAWSNITLRKLLLEKVGRARRMAMIDYHTGLGSYGNGMLIFGGSRESDAGRRALSWYGEDVVFNSSGEIGYCSTGGLVDGCAADYAALEFTGIVLEYGTWEIQRIADAMRFSFWLQRFGDENSSTGRNIKKELQDAFYVDADDWRKMVLNRSREVIGKAVSGLLSA